MLKLSPLESIFYPFPNVIQILIFTSLISINSCNINTSNEKDSSDIYFFHNINVDIDNIERINYTDIYKGVKYIKLETNENNLLGFISKICISDERLYILSPYPLNTVNVFNINGEFLYQIKRIGKGPGEYTDLQDIQVNDFVWLLDHYNKKLLKFTLDGEFIDKISTRVWADRFEFINKDTLIFYANNRYNEINNKVCNFQLIFMELTSRKIINGSLPFKRNFEKFYIRDYNNFTSSNKYILFNHSYNDTIYQISPDLHVLPRYQINFGKYEIPEKIMNKKYENEMEFSMSIIRSEYVYRFGKNVREFKNIIFSSFIHKSKLHHLLLSKVTGNIICYSNYVNDLEGYNITNRLNTDSEPLATTEKELVFLLEPQELISGIKKQKEVYSKSEWDNFKEKNPHLFELYNKTSKMDNPILVFYEIRNF